MRLTQPYYLGAHEVTVAQFRAFVKDARYKTTAERGPADKPETTNPFWSRLRDDQPVAYVSWDDAQEFCLWLSAKEQRTYRLPTEAQWESVADSIPVPEQIRPL